MFTSAMIEAKGLCLGIDRLLKTSFTYFLIGNDSQNDQV